MTSQDSTTANPQDEPVSTHNVGALLRASRLRIGDELRYVAETLHIRYIFLEAIEDGRYDELPGTAYAIGFIRSYADYLGLDSDEVVRRYKAESTSRGGNADLIFPVPIPESSIPGGAIVFVGIVIALLAYGGWYVSTAKDGFLAGLVSPVPERLNEPPQVAEPEQPIVVEQATESEPEAEPSEETVETVAAKTAQEETPVEVQAEQPLAETETPAVVETGVEKVEEVVEETAPPITEEPALAVEPVVAESEPEPTPEITEIEPVEAAEPETPLVVVEAEAPAETPEPAAEEPAQPVVEETPAPAPAPNPAPAPAAVEAMEAEPVPETAEPAATEIASAAAEPETAPDAPVTETRGDTSRIIVKARKNSWIQVRDTNANRLVMTRLLRAGDSYHVPNQSGLVLLTGNAGALEILVDGEAVPDLGESGKVRRNVTLDPELLRQGNAAE